MLLDDTPLFRKMIIPWYDSLSTCLLILVFFDLVFLYGFIGMTVARETHEYYRHSGIPVLLMVLSLSGGLSVCIRLFLRYEHYLKQLRKKPEPYFRLGKK